MSGILEETNCILGGKPCEENKLCLPITYDLSGKEEKDQKGICVDFQQLPENEVGSFKTDIRRVTHKGKKLIIFKFEDTENFSNAFYHDIEHEINIQNKINDKTDGVYAPKILSINRYKEDDKYCMIIVSESAADNNYIPLNTYSLSDYIRIPTVYPCVDNNCSNKLFLYFQIMNEIQDIYQASQGDKTYTHYSNDELKYYATFFNPENSKSCLEQWYIRVREIIDVLFISIHQLHKNNVFHHDLSESNIWVDENSKKSGKFNFKFIDFGVSSNFKENYTTAKKFKDFKEMFEKFTHFGEDPWMKYFDDTQQLPERYTHEYMDDIKKQETKVQNELNQSAKEKDFKFSPEVLKILMLTELTLPVTLPYEHPLELAYNDIQFLNQTINRNFIDIISSLRFKSELNIINQLSKRMRKEKERKGKMASYEHDLAHINPSKKNSVKAKIQEFKELYYPEGKSLEKIFDEIYDEVVLVYKNFLAEKYTDVIRNWQGESEMM